MNIRRFACNTGGIMAAVATGHEIAKGEIFWVLLFGLITISFWFTALVKKFRGDKDHA